MVQNLRTSDNFFFQRIWYLFILEELKNDFPSQSNFQRLPTELILMIAGHLDPSSKWALTTTCTELHLHISPSETKIILGECIRTAKILQQPQYTFITLCTMEGGCLCHYRLFCSRCVRFLHTSRFSDFARGQSPLTRECIDHEGKVWLCPLKRWSYINVHRLQTACVFWSESLGLYLDGLQDICECPKRIEMPRIS